MFIIFITCYLVHLSVLRRPVSDTRLFLPDSHINAIYCSVFCFKIMFVFSMLFNQHFYFLLLFIFHHRLSKDHAAIICFLIFCLIVFMFMFIFLAFSIILLLGRNLSAPDTAPDFYECISYIKRYCSKIKAKILEIRAHQKMLYTLGRGSELKIVSQCVVKRLECSGNHVNAIMTSRGRLRVGSSTKVILAMGTAPTTELMLQSFPQINNNVSEIYYQNMIIKY